MESIAFHQAPMTVPTITVEASFSFKCLRPTAVCGQSIAKLGESRVTPYLTTSARPSLKLLLGM